MLVTLSFGDYWNDGHGRHEELLIETEDCLEVERVLNDLKKSFNPCKDYSKSSLTIDEWEFIANSGYPFERFAKNFSESVKDFTSWDTFLKSGYHLYCSFYIATLIDFVVYFLETKSKCKVKECDTYFIDTKMGYGLFEE